MAMVRTDTNVTTATMSDRKHSTVAKNPTTKVATHGASVLGSSLFSARLTGGGQIPSRPLAQRTRAIWRVMARQALKNAITAPMVRIVPAVCPNRASTTYVRGVLELRKFF